jgi:hypothetical protein
MEDGVGAMSASSLGAAAFGSREEGAAGSAGKVGASVRDLHPTSATMNTATNVPVRTASS